MASAICAAAVSNGAGGMSGISRMTAPGIAAAAAREADASGVAGLITSTGHRTSGSRTAES